MHSPHSPRESGVPLFPPPPDVLGVVCVVVVDEAIALGADRPEPPDVPGQARRFHLAV